MSRAASLLMRIVFPIRGVRDFTCGYRAYRADVLQRAVEHYHGEFVDQDGFQCMVDILLKLRPMRLIFGEVPLLLRYDRKGGQSKMHVGAHGEEHPAAAAAAPARVLTRSVVVRVAPSLTLPRSRRCSRGRELCAPSSPLRAGARRQLPHAVQQGFGGGGRQVLAGRRCPGSS